MHLFRLHERIVILKVAGQKLNLVGFQSSKTLVSRVRVVCTLVLVCTGAEWRAIIQPAGREQSALSDPAREPGREGEGATPL